MHLATKYENSYQNSLKDIAHKSNCSEVIVTLVLKMVQGHSFQFPHYL